MAEMENSTLLSWQTAREVRGDDLFPSCPSRAILSAQMRAADVRQWIAQFEAVAEADRAELRRRGPRPAEAIRLALSMISAAPPGSVGDRRREQEALAINALWVTLHRRLRC